MIQRSGLHNRFEFSEQFWLLLFQVAYCRFVREQFAKGALTLHRLQNRSSQNIAVQYIAVSAGQSVIGNIGGRNEYPEQISPTSRQANHSRKRDKNCTGATARGS